MRRICQLVVLLAIVLQLPGCQPAGGTLKTSAETGALYSPVTALGRIDTETRLRELGPLKSGVLENLTVSLGDFVTTGEALATLSCNLEQAQLQVARANVDFAIAQHAVLEDGNRSGQIAEAFALVQAAEHRAANTKDDYQRQLRVANANLASKRTVAQLHRQADEARALLAAAKATVESQRSASPGSSGELHLAFTY